MGKSGRKKGAGEKKLSDADRANALGYRFLREGPLRNRPTPLADLLPSLLAKYGATRRLAVGQFRDCWEKIRAELLAPAGVLCSDEEIKISGFRGGTVSFEVASAPLAMEMSFYEGQMLRRFQEALPKENIKKIRFVQK